MNIYRKAERHMVEEIIRIMSMCFDDPTYVLKFFFEERFNIENCYVCMIDNKIVSVLHTMYNKLRLGKETLNGVYIYGACTLKQYRNLGCMTGLLNYVHETCREKGYECSFLVPGIPSLEKFYEKLGYKNLFKLRRIELNEEEILSICGDKLSKVKSIPSSVLNFYDIEKLRAEIYQNQSVVIYNENDLQFTDKLYKSFSFGGVINTDSGYAICGTVEPGELKIRDFTCKDSGTVELLSRIYNRFPRNSKYIIETSLSNQFFKDLGQTCFYGMIYPFSELCGELVNNLLSSVSENEYPYLGISLE